MFTADIAFSDLQAPVDIIGGSLSLGSSRITPLAHRMLRCLAIETDDAVSIACLERFGGDPHGFDHVRLHGAQAAAERLDEVRVHLLDWAILTIDRAVGTISYEASLVHSAPVYLREVSARLRVDWDCTRLLRDGTAPIEWPALMAHLAGMAPYAVKTLVSGLHRSVAGAILVARPGTIDVRLPAPAKMPGAQALSDGASAEDLLFDTVKALLSARDVDPRRLAVELSGGMDSALVGLAAADLWGPGLLSHGAQFDGAMGEAQRGRRDLLCDHCGFEDIAVPAGRFLPFGPRSSRRERFGLWPQDESYPEIFEAIFDMLASAGIDTLVSGFGGDELYAVYSDEEQDDDEAEALDRHVYLTKHGREIARNGMESGPRGLVADTSWLSAAGRSQRLLRRGIWPIYPYINPLLARFAASLPWDYRRDRMLLRRLLSEKLGNPVFRNDYVKESFREVALQGIAEHRDYLKTVLRRSPVLDPNLIRRDRVLAALAGDVAALPHRDFAFLFLVLTTCCFFDDPEASQPLPATRTSSSIDRRTRCGRT
jgi:asparagine synthase (glutamine-hydrolysing)